LKAGIAKEPKNVSLYFTLGNVYDNLSQKETDPAKAQGYADEAMVWYNKTLALDSKNSDAIYSIGASFYNKAAQFSKEMKKLESDFSKEGQKKYDAAEKLMIAEFDKALPYFKKAESINPNDQNTLIALKEIFAKKNDMNLSKEFKTRLDTVQSGGKNAKSYFTE
jgi:tetratricopeptide (TPR) repeat protein